MSAPTERVIALLLRHLVELEFRTALPDDDGAPGLRIAGFRDSEVVSLVAELLERPIVLSGHDESVRVVVGASRERPGIPADVILPENGTLTWFRNHNKHGLILIELEEQGDQAGIKAMHTILDSDLLSATADGSAFGRAEQVARIAWAESQVAGSLDLPDSLRDALRSVFDATGGSRPRSLRPWVAFVAAVCGRLAEMGRAADGGELRDAVCTELGHLNIFPDPQLFDRPASVAKRLEQNALMAAMLTPQGREVQDDEIARLIDAVTLLDEAGRPVAPEAAADLAQEMHRIHEAGGPDANSGISLRTWEQLFRRKRASTGLGTQIHGWISTHHEDRLPQFEDLQVVEGLDEGDSDSALILLRSETLDEEVPVVDLLSSALRKRVERLAFQGERVEPDPLIAILYGLHADARESGGPNEGHVRLEWESATESSFRSAQLFAFLYRSALLDIEAACDGTGVGYQFSIDDSIRSIASIASIWEPASDSGDIDDEYEEGLSRSWEPLRFRLVSSAAGTPLARFRWDPRAIPGWAGLAWLVNRGGSHGQLSIPSLDTWLESIFDGSSGSEELDPEPPQHPSARAWRDLTLGRLGAIAEQGISVELLDEYIDSWLPLASEAAAEFVPSGGADRGLDEFLSEETALTDEGRWVVLGTHPLRLRWLRHHIDRLTEFISRSLAGELSLNPENDRLYFDWLGRVSPHGQPPLISPQPQILATAVRDVQIHEEYATVPNADDQAQEWLGTLDSSSIDELAAAARSFVAAFPHKADGLSVLLMAPSGARTTARRFVEQLFAGARGRIDIELHVATRATDHDEVALALTDLDSAADRGKRLLPGFKLVLHPWDGGVPDSFAELEGQVDIALAPNLFGLHSTALEETKRNEPGLAGRFDPWLDATIHTRAAGDQTVNISRVLLPATPDPALQDWSTMSVRRRRQAPVSVEDPTGIDFITLQVAFEKNRDLFRRLHDVANWVITLDPFVGRDQIDALNDGPDIIVVKEHVGKNGSNTLVVSSMAGRPWVERQLGARLQQQFDIDAQRASAIAGRLYEVGRHVAPGLMLRALGLGRTIEEVLGLIFARYAVDASDPQPDGSGLEAWISLDDHMDWFGGAHRMRPDLLRVRIRLNETGPEVELLVLESKFRRKFAIDAADDQVRGGQALLEAAIGVGDEALDDAPFWRRELSTAINQLSRRSAPGADLPVLQTTGDDTNVDDLLAALRSGDYDLRRVDGIVCATAWGDTQPAPLGAQTTPAGFPLLRINRPDALRVLEKIEARTVPAPEAQTRSPETRFESDDDNASLDQTGEENGLGSLVPDPSATIANGRSAGGSDSTQPPVGRGTKPSAGARLPALVLENRYARILGKLDTLGVEVRRSDHPFQEGPGFCMYRVVPGERVSTDRVTTRLGDLKLALDLPAELNIRAYVDRGAVVIEVPKEDPDRYYVDAHDLWSAYLPPDSALAVPLGEDIEGNPVILDFSSSDTPHLLIAGQTGSGKSVALEAILGGLCQYRTPTQLQLLLVDPKGTELIGLADDDHVRGEIGWLAEDALEVLQSAVTEMERRYAAFKQLRVRSLPDYNYAVESSDQLAWWVIVLDEYADLTSDPDDRKRIEKELKRIAQKGRAAGIHLIVATQKPSAEVISTVIRSNLPAQLALRVKSAVDSRIILEEAGAESLAGKGDAFLRTAAGLRRVQCAAVAQDR